MSDLPSAMAFNVTRLGAANFEPVWESTRYHATEDTERVVAFSDLQTLRRYQEAGAELPSFEVAGRRRQLFFNPADVSAAIVTCGGLCPGQNDVIRAIAMTCRYGYGIERVIGYRYGYAGLSQQPPAPARPLSLPDVSDIHWQGGTMLSSSRGAPPVSEMVDTLERDRIRMLFAIGGDGTLRGASAIAQEIQARGLSIAVIGVPKTIDNDIAWIEQSFGFRTAVEEARRAILAAHVEARGAPGGIGLVKLMGRHSGFIAAHATLANPDVNFCLVPEVPLVLKGEGAFLPALESRLRDRNHAVIVVAEGVGQDLLATQETGTDASGNVKLKDIGTFLKAQIEAYLGERGLPSTIKYIDPSYMVRSLPANASDSKLCLMLGQHAVHAAMAGRTDMVVGYWNQHFTHVPIPLAVSHRKQLQPDGDTWQAVLASTGQG